TGRFLGGIFNNGRLAPGNSIGTMHATGPVTFADGSIYAVEINGAGESDLIEIDGTATLDGTVEVTATGADGDYADETDYVILTATGTITGRFDEVTTTSAFLNPLLIHGTNDVILRMTRNGTGFADVALTFNQKSVAEALDDAETAGPTDDMKAVLGAVASLSEAAARDAFDQLSGEVHASMSGVLIEDSRFVRNAANDRIRAAF